LAGFDQLREEYHGYKFEAQGEGYVVVLVTNPKDTKDQIYGGQLRAPNSHENVNKQEQEVHDLFSFKPDHTECHVIGVANDQIYNYIHSLVKIRSPKVQFHFHEMSKEETKKDLYVSKKGYFLSSGLQKAEEPKEADIIVSTISLQNMNGMKEILADTKFDDIDEMGARSQFRVKKKHSRPPS